MPLSSLFSDCFVVPLFFSFSLAVYLCDLVMIFVVIWYDFLTSVSANFVITLRLTENTL